MRRQEWLALTRQLRRDFPVSCPIHIRRVWVKQCEGATTFDGRVYRIRIKASLPWPAQVDALIHEWAHMLCIDHAYNHEEQWGVTHAQLYRSVLGD